MFARATVCFLPFAASLQVPGYATHKTVATRNAASVKAMAREQAAGPACYRLSGAEKVAAMEPFSKSGKGEWYACTGPADDQELTCFLAPSWMGLPDGQWVCSTDHEVGHPEEEDLSADDSY